ncbi:MAG: alanine racemase [Bacteroidales bacterium]|nr:alanine racemase [Bacteroidales bacterium]
MGPPTGEPVPLLLEVNCSRETAKGGIAPEELLALGDRIRADSGIRVEGLMTMAPFHENPERCRPVFAELRTLRDRLRDHTGWPLPTLSMGMSNDYAVAIAEGATIIRLGTTLFDELTGE